MSEKTPSSAAAKRPMGLTILGIALILALLALPFLPMGSGDQMPNFLRFAGHFHPVLLHLPIGVFILLFLQEFGRMVARRPSEPGLGFTMVFGVVSAVFAVGAGFLLWKSGAEDYAGNDLAERHLWGGIVFACSVVVVALLKVWSQVKGWRPASYRLPLFASIGIMSFASHDGASLTHGSDYLTQYAPAPVKALFEGSGGKKEANASPVVYEDVIAPIFERRCVQCHKPGKSKGGFRMDEFELLVKGGKEGPGLEPGNSEKSNIVVRMTLPLEDEEHMPPKGKPQVEEQELKVIRWWIDSGADAKVKLADAKVPADLEPVIASLIKMPRAAAGEAEQGQAKAHVGPDPKLKELVGKLSKSFPGMVSFESQESGSVCLSAVSMRGKLGDEEFKALVPLVPHLVTADLSGTNLTDASVASLKNAKSLRVLRLSETKITDASLATLAALPTLESLNLYGTPVSDQGLMKLAQLPNLKRIFLWQTTVTEKGIADFKQKLPGCEVVMGQ